MNSNSRNKIINTIGAKHLTKNIESDEFSYPKALKSVGKEIDIDLVRSDKGKTHKNLDIRFVKNNISILVETKDNFDKWNKEEITKQIQAYVNYEKVLTNNKIIALLANTEDDRIKVWWGSNLTIDESHQLKNQYSLKSFDEYADLYLGRVNNKEKVIKSTYHLNEILHKYGIIEKIRSQFVGTCLLALQYDVIFEKLSTKQILGGIEDVITNLLDKDLNKAHKLVILKSKVLESQNIKDLKAVELQEILRSIKNNILPFINDKNTMGQDILNLFFTTFNKYVGKADKNQAFTPDHIVHFMCQVAGVNRNSKVLDPCCGSGAFLVRAMTEAMDDCSNKDEQDLIKKSSIFGIEYEETAFGLSTTNMLIHSDGNSNIIQGSCFDKADFIENANINIVLMNPPYNAPRRFCEQTYVKTWSKKTKEDPSQGFHYVYYIASKVKTGKLAVLLPMQCAIGNSREIKKYKEKMLQEHTLDAVFSLPSDMFHPGANASACCMVFNLGIRHEKSPIKNTFFGYFKKDGFVKRKNLGRIERTKLNTNEGVWADIEANWLDCYRNRKTKTGLCLTKKITHKDEWLCEAYMETDYSTLNNYSFEKNIKEILAFKIITSSSIIKFNNHKKNKNIEPLSNNNWGFFKVKNIFEIIEPTKGITTDSLMDGTKLPYIAAKKDNNGLKCFVANDGNEDFISDGNCIVFIHIGAGSAGYTTYQPSSFIGMSGKTSCGSFKGLSQYIGAFLVTILDFERPRYSFGRSWTGDRLLETKIRIPINESGEPDWVYMEDFIKSLPYGNMI